MHKENAWILLQEVPTELRKVATKELADIAGNCERFIKNKLQYLNNCVPFIQWRHGMNFCKVNCCASTMRCAN